MSATAFDVDAARAVTPGCRRLAHLNNAGAGLMSQPTIDTVTDHLRLESMMGGYEAADLVAERVDATHRSAARLINADRDDIAFTSSDTAAWAKAFWGFAFGGGFASNGPRRVLVDRVFYGSHYLSLVQARRLFGIEIVTVPSLADATIDTDAFAALLDDDVAMVSTTMVPTHCGIVNPVEHIGRLVRGSAAVYIVDACQAVGQMAVDVERIGCDALTTTGRKWLRGPRGTGFLYTRASFASRCDPPGIDGRSASWVDESHYELEADAARFGEFEHSVAGVLGLGTAIDQLTAVGIDAVHARVQLLASRLRDALASARRVHVVEQSERRSGIVTWTMEGIDPSTLVDAARSAGINVNASRPTWSRLDDAFGARDGVVRASPHAYNTENEIDRLATVVGTLCG